MYCIVHTNRIQVSSHMTAELCNYYILQPSWPTYSKKLRELDVQVDMESTMIALGGRLDYNIAQGMHKEAS